MKIGTPAGSGSELIVTQFPETPAPARNTEALPELEPDRWEGISQPQMVESHFSFDEVTHQTVVEIRDSNTAELIREVPPEQVRKLARNIVEWVERKMDMRA